MGLCGMSGLRGTKIIRVPDPKAEEAKAAEKRKQQSIEDMRKRYEEMRKK